MTVQLFNWTQLLLVMIEMLSLTCSIVQKYFFFWNFKFPFLLKYRASVFSSEKKFNGNHIQRVFNAFINRANLVKRYFDNTNKPIEYFTQKGLLIWEGFKMKSKFLTLSKQGDIRSNFLIVYIPQTIIYRTTITAE